MQPQKVLRRIALAFLEEGEEEVLEFFRGWLMGKLEKYDASDLAYAVEHNLDLWEASPGKYQRLALGFAKKYRRLYDKYKNKLTAETVLQWMSEDRPDLASYVINDGSGKAMNWLEGMVDKVKLRLWEQNVLEQDMPVKQVNKDG